MVLHTLIVNLFKYIALLVGVAVVVRARVPTSWLKSLIAAILAILVIHLYAVSRHDLFGLDFQFFWKAGCDVWGGVDPYSPSRFAEHPFLNPPTALPLFALFAALPIRASLAFWTLLNVASSLGLIALARSALMSQDRLDVAGHQVRGGLESLPPVAIAGLAICLSFSEASLKGLYLGQLGVFTAVMLVLALVAQGRGRPIWAGVCLFLATVKFVTMIPFLVLFLRRAGPPGRGLCSHPGRGVVRSDRKDHRVARSRWRPCASGPRSLSAPGRSMIIPTTGHETRASSVSNTCFTGWGCATASGSGTPKFLALAAVGAWVAYLVILKDLPRPAAASLVSFFSLLFLYHRDYDTVILALPLAHCAGKVRVTTGPARWLYTACGLMAIAILYADALFLRLLTQRSLGWETWGRLVQATVLPYATWLILLAMLLLALATRAEGALTGEKQSTKGTLVVN